MTPCGFEGRVRENAHALERGELASHEEQELREHLRGCTSCRRELQSQKMLCALVRENAPSMMVSEPVWEGIQSQLGKRPRFRWAGLARRAAAALILGVFGFWLWSSFHDNRPVAAVVFQSHGSDPVLKQGHTVTLHEPVRVRTFSAMTMPGVGALRAREGTELVFTRSHEIRLNRGEVYVEIVPGGKGFKILVGPHAVEVVGTKYGVRWAEAAEKAEVYVLEGTVRCVSPQGTVMVRADQQVVLDRRPSLPEISSSAPFDHLAWIFRHEPAVILAYLAIDPVGQVPSGGRVGFAISVRSLSSVPVAIHALDHVRSNAFLKIKDPAGKEYAVRLDRETIHDMKAPRMHDDMVRLEPEQVWAIRGSVPSAVFAAPGRYAVSAELVVEKNGMTGAWFGTLATPPVAFER